MTQRPGQIPLFLAHTSRHDPVPEPEAAELGHALLARLRGDALTAGQRALLTRAEPPAGGGRASELDRRAPTPVIDVSETLLTLARGDDAEVRVSWRRYKGSSPFLDIRRWEREPGRGRGRGGAEGGGMHATRQGVTIRARELPRLLRVVVEVARWAGGGEHADRVAEDRVAEDRVAEGRVAEGRVAEGRVAEETAAEDE